jgi:hypothetical protein
MSMENEKTIKVNKDTPVKLAKNFLRQTNYLLKLKGDGAIGPKFVFCSVRVPQVKLY